MAEPTDAELDAAEERGRIAMATAPRARAARYDAENDRIVVDLANGCTFLFPARILQGLENASDDELAGVEPDTFGFGLHWERLDADFTVAGLMAGRFGTARYMTERFGRGWDSIAAE